jgi:hypothetical protein
VTLQGSIQLEEIMRKEDVAPAAPAVAPLTPMERSVVCALLALAHDAFMALDDAEESKAKEAFGDDYRQLCFALDALDELPDDKPGYTLDGPGRARWALRRLLGDCDAAAPAPAVAPTPEEQIDALHADDYARLGNQFIDLCIDLGCPDKTNMMDWVRARLLESPAVAPDKKVDELSMIVRQLVHALRRAAPSNALTSRAVDYLKRNGLQGSPLRAEAQPGSPHFDGAEAYEAHLDAAPAPAEPKGEHPELEGDQFFVSAREAYQRGFDDAKAEQRAATLSEEPSFSSPLTPYGLLVRALRIVAGTNLHDMSKALLTTPAKLSAMEFGRTPVTQEFAFDVSAYFDALGVPDTLAALKAALLSTLNGGKHE